MKRRLAVAFGVVGLIAGPQVFAQDFSSIGGQYMDFGASMAAVGQLNNVLGSTVRSPPERANSSPPRPAAAVDTRYRASPAVSARMRDRFADFAAKADPVRADALRGAVKDRDLLVLWERHVSVDGLRRGDVADAMTAYWVQNWQIANRVPTASRTQVQAVRRQFYRALASDPGFARLDDAARQEMAEAFMYNFVAQGSAFSDAGAKGDQGLTSRLSNAAATRFRNELKLDPRRLRLTDQGFVTA